MDADKHSSLCFGGNYKTTRGIRRGERTNGHAITYNVQSSVEKVTTTQTAMTFLVSFLSGIKMHFVLPVGGDI